MSNEILITDDKPSPRIMYDGKEYDTLRHGYMLLTIDRKPNIYWRIKFKIMNFFTMPLAKIVWTEEKK